MKPIRIQRKRTKGWRMPENTVYVGRPTRWGNPFPTHELPRDGHGDIIYGETIQVRTAAQAVKLFADMLVPYRHHGERSGLGDFYLSTCNMETIKHELGGKNLACWCRVECEECEGSGKRYYAALRDLHPITPPLIQDKCFACGGSGRYPCHADVLLEIANG